MLNDKNLALNYKIILGSQSPRRSELLSQLGFSFQQISLNVDESYSNDIPAEKVAEYLSIKKAKAYKNRITTGELLITADTTVCLKNEILDKPKNSQEAFEMLTKLSDCTHKVITGVCLTSTLNLSSFSVKTLVTFRKLTTEEIHHYIKNYQPLDKAGAYGIQEWIGSIGVSKIKGSYTNVVGLPLFELYKEMTSFLGEEFASI
ncbi:MAG: septum formation protein Maf [Verrucomicrobia bacterium]|nr:septum formation protein Maf [Verrucomicrobiota bacterium]